MEEEDSSLERREDSVAEDITVREREREREREERSEREERVGGKLKMRRKRWGWFVFLKGANRARPWDFSN